MLFLLVTDSWLIYLALENNLVKEMHHLIQVIGNDHWQNLLLHLSRHHQKALYLSYKFRKSCAEKFIKKGATHFMWKVLYSILEKGWSLSLGSVWNMNTALEF